MMGMIHKMQEKGSYICQAGSILTFHFCAWLQLQIAKTDKYKTN